MKKNRCSGHGDMVTGGESPFHGEQDHKLQALRLVVPGYAKAMLVMLGMVVMLRCSKVLQERAGFQYSQKEANETGKLLLKALNL